MSKPLIVLIAAVWLSCAVLIYGITLAHFQQKFPYSREREDAGFAIVMACFLGIAGPLGLAFAFCLSGFAHHGLQFIPQAAKNWRETA